MQETSLVSKFMNDNVPAVAKRGMYKKISLEVMDACYLLRDRGYSHRQIASFLASEGYQMTKDQVQKMFSRNMA